MKMTIPQEVDARGDGETVIVITREAP